MNKCFKDYINSIKGSPYFYLESNTDDFKEAEKEAGIDKTQDEKDEQNSKSLLQYLLNISATHQ